GYSIFELEVYGPSSNASPVITLQAPNANQTFNSGSTIVLSATAVDTDGSITKVEFYNGSTKLGEDLVAPYNYSWTNVGAGNYNISAKATDNLGATTQTMAVPITVIQTQTVYPTVSITSPTNGSSYLINEEITLTSNAADSDGNIVKVDYYLNGVFFNTRTVVPYLVQYSSSIAATHVITAIAYDNAGLSTTSSPITIYILAPPTNIALNKPATSSSTNGGNTAAKAVDGNSGSRWESVSADPQWITVDLQQTYSINRVKILWEGAYGKDYKIQTSNTNNGTDWADIKTVTGNTTLNNDWTGLSGSGRYLRVYGTSRGTGWGYSIFELEVYGNNTPTNVLPTVTLDSPLNNQIIGAGTIYLYATATDSDGSIAKVEFFNGATKIGEDLTSPYSFEWLNVSTGTYTLTAKATDNLGGTATSTAASITVDQAPVVNITSPANNSVFTVNQSFPITASATDADGTIARVEFFMGGVLLLVDYTAPFETTGIRTVTGPVFIGAVAYDNLGFSTSSPAILVNITNAVSTNLALNKPATSSSVQGSNTAAKAVDGVANSRWESLSADPQWITVDLQQTYTINEVKIVWEPAYGKNYTIQTSNTNNGTDWVTIKTVTGNTVLTNDWTGLTGSGRYIRIYGTVRGTGYGYSIFELEVYGTSPASVASAPAGSTESISAYPNPAQDQVSVSFTSETAIAETAELVVFDQFSQPLATYTKASGADVVHINTSSLQPGAYLIKINSNGNYSVKRILITK
ncbi:MAG: discoidin domain-containing protein, partial [Cytophagales bacterium]|nr:discoidin domain-containing protein [Cytophaga sp.]